MKFEAELLKQVSALIAQNQTLTAMLARTSREAVATTTPPAKATGAEKILETVSEIVHELGRDTIIEMTGVTSSQINKWGFDSKIPAKFYVVMIDELIKRGYTAHPQLWGQVDARKGQL